MGQAPTRKTSVPPLDFSSFLKRHLASNVERPPSQKPKKNRFGNIPPKSSRKKKANGNGDKVPTAMIHGANSQYMRNRYADKRTPEGQALLAIVGAIEKDIGKPFDARQSLLMSLIRSKVIVIMCIGKYLESVEEIVDYTQGTVAHVVDKTFFYASASLRSALKELYDGNKNKGKAKQTYEEIVKNMGKD